jgi:HD-GYP domain-containing protein (c-di-GMP phosphodiesterase class II)
MGEDYKRKGMMNQLIKIISNNPDVIRCCISMKNYNENLYDHSINVAYLSMVFGSSCYKNLNEITELFIASILHDYGKMYISRSILDKPGMLTADERKKIEMHSIMGYIHLKKQTKLSNNILYGVLDHHEKVDGSGYSQGKKSCEISDYAKIITIADVYDAMISDRVYRKKFQRDEVSDYINNNAGNHFDKELVHKFLNLIEEIPNLENLEMRLKSMLTEIQQNHYLIFS